MNDGGTDPVPARPMVDPAAMVRQLAAASRPDAVAALDLGRVPFAPMAAVQAAYLELRRAKPRQAGDVLLLLEHEPVVTVSRRADGRNLLWDEAQRRQRGLALAEVDRGGDVTFHGPGQLVAYPLLDLDAPRFRLGSSAYMHRLEQVVVATLAGLGLAAHVEPGLPGVWVPHPRHGRSAKICAIGTRVSRGLTKHGFALNHTVDLRWFDSIVPCGLPLPVTSLAELQALQGPEAVLVGRAELLQRVVAAFAATFGVPVQPVRAV